MSNANRPKPPEDFDDNPEWGDEFFARARWVADGSRADAAELARLRRIEAAARDLLERGATPDAKKALRRALDQAADTAA
ncbi:MAG: hypothetical protein AAF676_04830 [Pseudomonadota bacterium]